MFGSFAFLQLSRHIEECVRAASAENSRSLRRIKAINREAGGWNDTVLLFHRGVDAGHRISPSLHP